MLEMSAERVVVVNGREAVPVPGGALVATEPAPVYVLEQYANDALEDARIARASADRHASRVWELEGAEADAFEARVYVVVLALGCVAWAGMALVQTSSAVTRCGAALAAMTATTVAVRAARRLWEGR